LAIITGVIATFGEMNFYCNRRDERALLPAVDNFRVMENLVGAYINAVCFYG
jgi:hypothetical protein